MADEATSPLAETVKLISADGFEFVIDRKCAMASGTIKNMLSSPGMYTFVRDLYVEHQLTEE